MVVNENLTTYLHSLEQDGPDWLEVIREQALAMEVPIIRREMEPLLRVLLTIQQPKRILEIGTGVGYSALFMESCLEEGRIVTIENYGPRLQEARKNLAGHARISLLEADAADAVKEMAEPFDFVFLDAAKAQYITLLPELLRLMRKGSVLLADNVLQEGDLIWSRFVTPRRQRTVHERMRAFLWEIKHCQQLDTSILTVGDGASLSVRR